MNFSIIINLSWVIITLTVVVCANSNYTSNDRNRLRYIHDSCELYTYYMTSVWYWYCHTEQHNVSRGAHSVINRMFLAFDFCRFCVIIRVYSSPPQRPMTKWTKITVALSCVIISDNAFGM